MTDVPPTSPSPPILPRNALDNVPSIVYATKCVTAKNNIDQLLRDNPEPSDLAEEELLRFAEDMTRNSRVFNTNLDKLGPVHHIQPFNQLKIPIGNKIIKESMVYALQSSFGPDTSDDEAIDGPGINLNTDAWEMILNKNPWLRDGLFSDTDSILINPTDGTDTRSTYAYYILQTLQQIIMDGALIIPNQIPSGHGDVSRIAHQTRLATDPDTGVPYDVPRWHPSDEPALWFHTESGSSAEYAKSDGESVALVRQLSNKTTNIDRIVMPGGTENIITKNKLVLFLNLDSIDYNPANRDTWLSNTPMISRFVNLITNRYTQWNVKQTPDLLFDTDLIRGYSIANPDENRIIIPNGKWGTERDLTVNIYNSLSSPYCANVAPPYTGYRLSSFQDDKLFHYPLVDFLSIFSDMINWCLQSGSYMGAHTIFEDMLDNGTITDPEIEEIFGDGDGFDNPVSVEIFGTCARIFKNAIRLDVEANFSAETVITGRLLNSLQIFRETTGITELLHNRKGIPFSRKSGGAKKRKFVDMYKLNNKFDICYKNYFNKYLRNYYGHKFRKLYMISSNKFIELYMNSIETLISFLKTNLNSKSKTKRLHFSKGFGTGVTRKKKQTVRPRTGKPGFTPTGFVKVMGGYKIRHQYRKQHKTRRLIKK